MFTPSIVPSAEETVYLVDDDYGPIGRSFRETDATKADRETTLRDLISGQFDNPVRDCLQRARGVGPRRVT